MSQNVYLVASQRTPVGKANKGAFKHERPDDMLANIIKGTLAKVPDLDPGLLEDGVFGCAMPEGPQGMNVARVASLLAGVPEHVPAMTVNRFCSSGIESMAIIAQRIMAGAIDCGMAGGVESMSLVPMGGNQLSGNPNFFNQNDKHIAIAYGMGITAELVAEKYNVSRQAQDEFAVESHRRALKAIKSGYDQDEIIPYEVTNYLPGDDGQVKEQQTTVAHDEGPRESDLETLSKLKPSFSAKGSVTPGNSSQVSDGAACAILVSERFLKEHNLTPIARFVDYQVAGVPPEIMGIGPVMAIPKVLKSAGISQQEVGWIELNEAFSAQSLAVINELGLDPAKVNPNGGAIALGHPLGATGAIRAATALHNAKRIQANYAMVTMCVGTGMGAAGLFEIL